MRNSLLAIAAASIVLSSSASAQDTSNIIEFDFSGVVEYVQDDEITLRGRSASGSFPGSPSVTIPASEIPEYLYEAGSTIHLSYRVNAPSELINNPACGGRFRLNGSQASVSNCELHTTLESPFGRMSYGDYSHDQISGLFLEIDPVTGALSLDIPDGEYEMRWLAVHPYSYDSTAQKLTGVQDRPCVSDFFCYDGKVFGTIDSVRIPIKASGDYGDVQPGYNVGYFAGYVRDLVIRGAYSFGGSGGATQVPEPATLPTIALGLLALGYIRKRKLRQKRG